MRRRIDIEPDNVVQLGGELRVGGQLELAHSMRLQPVAAPDTLHRGNADPDGLGHRGPGPPFGEEEMADYAPTGPVDQAERVGINYDRRRLILLGNRARALAGPKEDWKLARLIEIVRDLAEGRVAPDCFLPVYPDSLLCGHACTEITGPRICRIACRGRDG